MLSVKHTVVIEAYLVILFCFAQALPFHYPVAINEQPVDSISSLTMKEKNPCSIERLPNIRMVIAQ